MLCLDSQFYWHLLNTPCAHNTFEYKTAFCLTDNTEQCIGLENYCILKVKVQQILRKEYLIA